MSTSDELFVDVLRAAGHRGAAELAEKLIGYTAGPEKQAEEPAAPQTHAEAEGILMREAMFRDLGLNERGEKE